MSEYCFNCGLLCCGKQQIQISKDHRLTFCHNCINLLQNFNPSELIKILKKGNTIIT